MNPGGVPIQTWCPSCGERHIDRGEWATRLHKTHLCEHCGAKWRPYDAPTVGVADRVAYGVPWIGSGWRLRADLDELKRACREASRSGKRLEDYTGPELPITIYEIPWSSLHEDTRRALDCGEEVITGCGWAPRFLGFRRRLTKRGTRRG